MEAKEYQSTIRAALKELLSAHGISREILPDARFSEDLMLDSISRIELLRRLERAFKRDLSDPAFVRANSIEELLRCLEGTVQRASQENFSQELDERRDAEVEDLRRSVETFATIPEVFSFWKDRKPDRTHLLFIEGDTLEKRSYSDLFNAATSCAHALAFHGISRGDRVAIMMPSGVPFLCWYLGILLSGGVPVPMYPPPRLDKLEEHVRKHEIILQSSRARVFIGSGEIDSLRRLLQVRCPTLKTSLNGDEIPQAARVAALPRLHSQDLALVQYTSGSTGDPKGVMLSHYNLLSNISAMARAIRLRKEDLFVSWLPLYHDMGLIGAWLGSLVYAIPLVLVSPLSFLGKPALWLKLISRYQGTISAGPNFAYDLCAHKLEDDELTGVNLSSWRLALNGAEPVRASTIRAFSKRFAAYGFSPHAMTPVYGLAESSLGVLFPPRERGPRIEGVRRDVFESSGKIMPLAAHSQDSLEFVSSGLPLPDHKVRLVNEAGAVLGERQVGLLQFSGPSASEGYLDNESGTAALRSGEWRNSDDYAFSIDGEYFITGRQKDLIIKAGRNFYPQDLEEIAERVEGVRRGCVAAFASDKTAEGTERVVILAESKERNAEIHAKMRESISREIFAELGLTPDEVHVVSPRSIPKTSSGKLRRSEAKARFEKGRLTAERSVTTQIARLVMGASPLLIKRLMTSLLLKIYGVWCWVILLVCAIPFFLGLVALPSFQMRRKVARLCARTALLGCGLAPKVSGKPASSTGGLVMVSNHLSYVDAILLTAVLPSRVRFIAKSDFLNSKIMHTVLSKLEVFFVTRFSAAHAEKETQTLVEKVRQGAQLVFFAEGTFQRAPGILPFQMGAFMVAAHAGVPVQALAISGTREILPDLSWLPRPGRLKVSYLGIHTPRDNSFEEAARIKKETREEILHFTGESDLQ